MRRLAQRILDLLRERSWQRQGHKPRLALSAKLQLEALEDRCLPAVGPSTVLPAALTGTAFVDTNNNGHRDANELVLPGATVSLSGTDFQGKAVSATTGTDAHGVYKFIEVNPGTYQLGLSTIFFVNGTSAVGSQGGVVSGSTIASILIPPGQTLVNYDLAVLGLVLDQVSLRDCLASTPFLNGFPQTNPNVHLATPGSGLAYADGLPPPTQAGLTTAGSLTLAGTVQDTGGAAVPNVTVALTGITTGGTNAGLPVPVVTVTTDSNGAFSFTKLVAGTYSLNVAGQPAGFRAGVPTVGNLGGLIKQNDVIGGIELGTTDGSGYIFVEQRVTAPAPGTMEGHLVDDTAGAGGTASDSITADPTTAGSINLASGIVSFTGAVDPGAGGTQVNLLPYLKADRTFFLSRDVMSQMRGGTLADGQHTLNLSAVGADGTVATQSLTFTLLTLAPTIPTVHLDATSDPRQIGRPVQTGVTILGHADPNVAVTLIPTDALGNPTGTAPVSTTSTAAGDFSFAQTLNQGPNDFTFRVTDKAGNQSQTQATFVVNRPPTGTIANVTVNNPAADQVIDLAGSFTDPDASPTLLRLHTQLGTVDIQLKDGQDPQMVANFLNYVNSGRYTNTIFHRLSRGFVLQGGGFQFNAGALTPVITDSPVKHDATTPPTGGANVRGTVAMALSSGPDSGTSQYFFNLANNSGSLDATANGGPFIAFAAVADGFSQRILDNLASLQATNESNAPGAAVNTVQNVTIMGNPTGGTFTLSLGNTASTPIAFNASAATVAAAIAGLPTPSTAAGAGTTIGAANVDVTGTPGNWIVTFKGNLAGTNVDALMPFPSLSGGTTPTVTVTVATHGAPTNSALGPVGTDTSGVPLLNYSGTAFPTDAAASNFELIQSIEVLRQSEALTYTITNNTNPIVASASLSPTANNRLTLHFGNVASDMSTSITVVATDKSGASVSSMFTVNVKAANQPPTIINQTFNAAVGSAVGTVIGTVAANDLNSGGTLSYAFTDGNTAFNIDSATGKIAVKDSAQLGSQLATGRPFSLTVKVTDSATGQNSSASVFVNVTQNQTPTISDQSFTVAAGSPNNTVFGAVAASDPDPGQTLTYAITAGNANNAFKIDPATGKLSVNDTTRLAAAQLTVSVTDNDATPLGASATVTVTVNANQAPTIANQRFDVPSTSSNGTVVGTVTASDPNPGQTITFSITAGNTGNALAIDPVTGKITVANSAALSNSPFTLTIRATNNNTTPLFRSATVSVIATAGSTVPTIAGQTFSVVDGNPVGSFVGTVAASDADGGDGLTYAITGGNTGGTFQIDNSGNLTVANNALLNQALSPSGFSLTVQVTDTDSGTANAATVVVNINPNHAPVIANRTLSIPHGSAVGTLVGTPIGATDPDAGQTVSYAIIAGNTGGAFSIDPTTGQIRVANSAAVTTANQPFSLLVQVSDNDAQPLYASATVTVNVT
jgi:cyclophilin family peptidyl-prolyl cis-trans isomerase